MTFRDQLFRRYRQSRNADAWKPYKEARTSVKQLLKNAEYDHIRTEVWSHKDNPGSLWKIINTCIPSKEKETSVYSRDTELVANYFNQFFSSVGRNAAQTAAQLAINISDTSLISTPMTRNSSEELFNYSKSACASSKTAFLLSLALWRTSSTVLSQLLPFQTPGKHLRSYHYWKMEITRSHQIIAPFRCLPLLQRSARR